MSRNMPFHKNCRVAIQSFQRWLLYLILSFLCGEKLSLFGNSSSAQALRDKSSSLWEPAKNYSVVGPNVFPKPTHLISNQAVPILQPTFGEHRPDSPAIFAYAEGYELASYRIFLESLRRTGFDGDVVIAIAALDICEAGVVDYVKVQPNVVVYATNLTCSADKFETITARKPDGFQMCKLNGIYGIPTTESINPNGATTTTTTTTTRAPVPDPRPGRVVATLRYELYWVWALKYSSTTWLMLLDARDAYFQSNPFVDLPRQSPPSSPGKKVTNGLLYFFGENTNATRLQSSVKNRKWLERGYSIVTSEALGEKPILCSGSTMGEQIAIEAYLRAMINEWDETHIFMTGADQGFHNYLYYSGKLQNVQAIRRIEIFEQGMGRINNLGALRRRPLSTWRYDPDPNDPQRQAQPVYNNKTHEIFNRDGSLSPVVHQWDRDAALFRHADKWMRRYRREFREEFEKNRRRRRRKYSGSS